MLTAAHRPRAARRSVLAVTALVGAATALAACTTNSPSSTSSESGKAGPITVTSTATTCEVSATQAPSGPISFSVTNKGDEVTEFYLLADDKLRIVGEVENIGPGLTRDLVVVAQPGTYYTDCKPGMKGDGIQAAFTVTDSGTAVSHNADDAALLATANAQYGDYVRNESGQLVTKTNEFVAAYLAGDAAKAKDLYPRARTHWERIETVAESFGDLDPAIDAREADLEPGQQWTGWHVLEKDLWPPATGYTPLTPEQRQSTADKLVADTKTLDSRISTMTFTTDQIANGSKGLLDEVAKAKVTGEEEIWSHTDLWDFQANVDGARVGWEGLRPVLQHRNATLDTELQTRFAELQALLDTHKSADGFVSYETLTTDQVKQLSDAVNALSEPLSRLTAAVV